MLIENVFMELRARLRSCNVFITTAVDFKKNCNLKICIQSNCIIMNYYPEDTSKRSSVSSVDSLSDCFSDDDSFVTEVVSMEQFCNIIPNSMSGLKIDKNSISFRILTEPKSGGNFYKELLSPTVSTSKFFSTNTKIDLNAGEEVKILCANCVNVISDNVVKFDRILELPSENLDMSDWFCHHHGNAQESVIKSNKYDFLYRLSYFMVNNCLMADRTNKFNSKRDVYHCDRCLAWLGVKSQQSVKLFNSTIKISRSNDESAILKHKNAAILDKLCVSDFVYTIECLTKEFNVGFQYAIMCKIILECNIGANNKQFLLIWVMDKELQVLRSSGECVVKNDETKIKMASSFLTKILYKIETSLTEEVETWSSDPSIVTSEISKNMFFSGIDHLTEMSLRVPETFRSTNGYCVTYLKV